MKDIQYIDKLVSRLLFTGLSFGLVFIYFAQERLYNSLNFGDISLGPERYLRIACVLLIVAVVVISVFRARKEYKPTIFLAYFTLLTYLTLNYLLYGEDIFDLTDVMGQKGLGPWLCFGLIFVSYDDRTYERFKYFLLISALVIIGMALYNLIDFGVGAYRGQAMSKYRIFTVNLMWIAPYVFLMLKNHKKLGKYRSLILLPGISLALITQTRSFLIIYFLVLVFDFFYAKKKGIYIISGIIMAVLFAAVLFTSDLSTSFELLGQRGLYDSRTDQLSQFFSQINMVELIVGKGPDSTWNFFSVEYQFLDNQWMLLLWWGGLIPFLMYFFLTAFISVKMFLTHKDYETRVESFVLILWVLACAGLAIYTTMSVDYYFFAICIIQGRLLYKYSKS